MRGLQTSPLLPVTAAAVHARQTGLKLSLPHGEKTIDLSGLPAGMYQIRAKSDEDYFSGKLLVL